MVSSDKRVDVEYISLESMDAVLWNVRSSSVGSAELYRPVERGGGGGLACEIGAGADVRSWAWVDACACWYCTVRRFQDRQIAWHFFNFQSVS